MTESRRAPGIFDFTGPPGTSLPSMGAMAAPRVSLGRAATPAANAPGLLLCANGAASTRRRAPVVRMESASPPRPSGSRLPPFSTQRPIAPSIACTRMPGTWQGPQGILADLTEGFDHFVNTNRGVRRRQRSTRPSPRPPARGWRGEPRACRGGSLDGSHSRWREGRAPGQVVRLDISANDPRSRGAVGVGSAAWSGIPRPTV
jgi:hypothetical protein